MFNLFSFISRNLKFTDIMMCIFNKHNYEFPVGRTKPYKKISIKSAGKFLTNWEFMLHEQDLEITVLVSYHPWRSVLYLLHRVVLILLTEIFFSITWRLEFNNWIAEKIVRFLICFSQLFFVFIESKFLTITVNC